MDNSSVTRTTRTRLDIQGLRAIAVLAVVLDHARVPGFEGGYVGVDVFLVLSGFLITLGLVREADGSRRVSMLAFYARRARRILPAATLVLVTVLAVSALGLGYVRGQQVSTDVWWAAVFLANVHLADLGTDYFASGLPPSPVQHYWSLSVEEQFYLVWPVLLAALVWIALRSAPKGRHAADRRVPWRIVTAMVAVLCAASLAWSVLLVREDPTAAYFSSFARSWELGAGVLVALVAPALVRLGRAARHLLALGGVSAIVVAVLTFDAATPVPGYHALLPVLGTAALLAAGVGAEPVGVARSLTIWPLTWLGDLSYSLYLWHWPVLVLGADLLGPLRPAETGVLMLGALALSALTYRYVENPVRRSRGLAGPGWPRVRSLALWPAAVAVVAASSLGAHTVSEQRLQDRLADGADYLALRAPGVPVGLQLQDSLDRAASGSPVAYPLTSTDELDDLARDLWHEQYTCNAEKAETTVELCPIGDVDADRTLMAFGDSHLGQWLPALDRLAAAAGYRVVPLVKLGCTPFDVDLEVDEGTGAYTQCADFREWATGEIERLRPEVVVVGGRAMQGSMTGRRVDRAAAWTEGVRTTLARLTPLTPDLRVLSDVSGIEVEPLDCLTDPGATMATCTSDERAEVREGNAITAELTAEAGATYVDVTPLACRSGRCPAVAGGLMVYGDGSHLSRTWVGHVADEAGVALGL